MIAIPESCQSILFQASQPLSLGVEIEVQLVDWKTLELCPAAPRLLKALKQPCFQPEYFQSNLELVTGICQDLSEVERDLKSAGRKLLTEAEKLGVDIVGAGTHPFDGGHCDAPLYPSERYRKVHERSRWVASYMSTFGLHVHVGAKSSRHAMALIHGVAPYLAHLLALSASSPFQAGKDTGLASSRVTVFESMPTTGTPPMLADWSEFELLVHRLTTCKAIESLKDLLWDIRPSPGYGTVEVRICDGLPCLDDTLALVAAVRSLFAWVDRRWRSGETFPPAANWRLRENKWRAARWGTDAYLVISEQGEVRSVREEWQLLLGEMRGLVPAEDLDRLQEYLQKVPPYARQRRIFQDSGSLRTVVQELAQEWKGSVLC